MSDSPIAVVLLSGGMDSAVVLASVVEKGFSAHALSFNYGQRHRYELQLAKKVAANEGATAHREIILDGSAFRGSALTDDIVVPKGRPTDSEDIPVTYVPARNLVFLSMASAYAESVGSTDIFLGVNAVDYSGYPDCRPEFISSFEKTVNLGTRVGIEGEKPLRIHAPLQELSKAGIVQLGQRLGVDFGSTLSCYDPHHEGTIISQCGECDACQLRSGGFMQSNLEDPGRVITLS